MNARRLLQLLSVMATVLAVGACGNLQTPPTDPATIGKASLYPSLMRGYLDNDRLPDSLALLPAPPQPGSVAFNGDEQAYADTRSLVNQPRGELARRDAHLKFPDATEAFHCAMGFAVDGAAMPHLQTLMRRVMADSALSTFKAKDHYKRVRPFIYNKQASCTPNEDASLAKNGSYPSGHAALGWAWALVLAELMPERANALFQRAFDYGRSRVICGAHWQSDIDAGRLMGAASVAVLHTDPAFRAQMELAGAEIAAMQRQTLSPPKSCELENQVSRDPARPPRQ